MLYARSPGTSCRHGWLVLSPRSARSRLLSRGRWHELGRSARLEWWSSQLELLRYTPRPVGYIFPTHAAALSPVHLSSNIVYYPLYATSTSARIQKHHRQPQQHMSTTPSHHDRALCSGSRPVLRWLGPTPALSERRVCRPLRECGTDAARPMTRGGCPAGAAAAGWAVRAARSAILCVWPLTH